MHAWGGAKKKETWENLYLFFTCLYIDARAHACARIGDTYPFMRACVNMHARMRYTYLFVRVREKTRNVHARSQVIAKKVWMTGSQSLWRGLWRAYRIFPSFFIVFFFPFFIASFFPFLLLKLFHFFFSSCHPFSPFLLRWDGIDKVYRCTKESEREREGGGNTSRRYYLSWFWLTLTKNKSLERNLQNASPTLCQRFQNQDCSVGRSSAVTEEVYRDSRVAKSNHLHHAKNCYTLHVPPFPPNS